LTDFIVFLHIVDAKFAGRASAITHRGGRGWLPAAILDRMTAADANPRTDTLDHTALRLNNAGDQALKNLIYDNDFGIVAAGSGQTIGYNRIERSRNIPTVTMNDFGLSLSKRVRACVTATAY